MANDLPGGPIVFYGTLGIVAGIVSTTLGIGSGIVMVPALTILAAFPQKEAQGVALFVMIPMAIMGATRYYLNPEIHINFKAVILLSIAVIIGANIGAYLVDHLSNRSLKILFACLLLVAGIRMIWSALKSVS